MEFIFIKNIILSPLAYFGVGRLANRHTPSRQLPTTPLCVCNSPAMTNSAALFTTDACVILRVNEPPFARSQNWASWDKKAEVVIRCS